MKATRTGIFWFNNDLRIHDQAALAFACEHVDMLICVYVIDEAWFQSDNYSQKRIGEHRLNFLIQSLVALDQQLRVIGQQLLVVTDHPVRVLSQLIENANANHLFRSENVGWYENQAWQQLIETHPQCEFSSIETHTLFEQQQLPFELDDLPTSFAKFRKQCEQIDCNELVAPISSLPPPSPNIQFAESLETNLMTGLFDGGELAALEHTKIYFSDNLPAHYKEVRNSLDGWENSTKFSAWLANGCLSVRNLAAVLKQYENEKVANESTYWIYFELLWREYFQWYAKKHGEKLFAFKGIANTPPLTSFYPERFRKWVNGTTPYPLVNACMNELSTTGYLSNRGRQIVASCLINELSIDWRFGAAHFEQTLIDYDVASNWGNWQYIAGVGADSRGGRHFNLEKQTQQFDPRGDYQQRWQGSHPITALDSQDAADWPIS